MLSSNTVQAVAALAAMSAFLTGFNSVRAHSHRDSSSQRLDRLYESTLGVESTESEADTSPLTPLLEELHNAAGELIVRRPPDVFIANLALLALSAIVVWVSGQRAGWRLTGSPDADFAPIAALVVAQVFVVGVMLSELRYVRRQLVEKLRWLTMRQPSTIVRMIDDELATVELLVSRTLSAASEGRTDTAKKLVNASVRRAERSRDVLKMIGQVFDEDFVAASHDIKKVRPAAMVIGTQSIWLAETLSWFQEFLRLTRSGGTIEPPPERPSVSEAVAT